LERVGWAMHIEKRQLSREISVVERKRKEKTKEDRVVGKENLEERKNNNCVENMFR
jgi:hypothetical protein